MALISSKATNGIDEVVFNDAPNARQRYKLNGTPVVGVTSFTKGGYPTSEGLTNWKIDRASEFVFNTWSQDADKLSLLSIDELLKQRIEAVKQARVAWKVEAEEAAGIGVAVHNYAELASRGKRQEALQSLVSLQDSPQWPEIANAVYKVDDFLKQNEDEIIATEQIVGSVQHQYAGRFDRLVRRGKLVIMSDYKTSKSFYIDQFVQDAAYAIAVEEWLGIHVDGFEVIRFGKSGGDFKQLLITDPDEISALRLQALRCLHTYRFAQEWNKDERFSYERVQSKRSSIKS